MRIYFFQGQYIIYQKQKMDAFLPIFPAKPSWPSELRLFILKISRLPLLSWIKLDKYVHTFHNDSNIVIKLYNMIQQTR